jgi:hypothetical protein
MIILLSGLHSKAQQFEKAPQDFKEIHFTYERKANAVFTDRGLFADTLLLKLHFPNVKFIKEANPKNPTHIYGYGPV